MILLLITACQDMGENDIVLSNSKKKQPVIIVNANRHLKMAEFWIDRIEEPDKLIMGKKEIEKFNHITSHKRHTSK